MMNDSGIPFPDEAAHLADISKKLEKAIRRAEADVENLDRDYRDAKRYMAQYRGELDPHEMFQNELLLKQTDRTGAFAVEVRDRLLKLRDSPYFARIDFCPGDRREPSQYYIGKFTFNYENHLLVFDWRAPVSGMFYDYELGPAGYDAPNGRIEGELTGKRQFKIKDGVMEYALESSAHVQDDILQKELSHTSDEKMKSIISTIQKEQNRIIRNGKAQTLIIQGVAGSGKTSIALHRIAFLLYRFKKQLNARNVVILSPNKVFGDYISNVIPELGEEPVSQLGLEDIADVQLEGVVGFDRDRDPIETEDEAWAGRAGYKSTAEFVELLEEYVRRLQLTVFAPSDYTWGRFTADGPWIGERFLAYGRYPVRKRLSMVAEDIHDRFVTGNIMEDRVPGTGTILKSLKAMLTVRNSLDVYKDFYRSIGHPEMFVMPSKKTLEWTDVYPFMYIHAAFEGIRESGVTKHLVIDEMQDYTPIQFAVLNRMFPCPKTILGDFSQSVHPVHLHGLDDLMRIYPDAEFVRLNKSYRSTYEIITFAKRILNTAALEPVERHGREPEVIRCLDREDEIRRIRQAIGEFKEGKSASMGIIVKTNREAMALFELLSGEEGTVLITPESTGFRNGVSITSVHMSKGLEFDEVVIPSADSRTYSSGHDRNLLYIACTRAMHRLTLLYTGEPTGLADDGWEP